MVKDALTPTAMDKAASGISRAISSEAASQLVTVAGGPERAGVKQLLEHLPPPVLPAGRPRGCAGRRRVAGGLGVGVVALADRPPGEDGAGRPPGFPGAVGMGAGGPELGRMQPRAQAAPSW